MKENKEVLKDSEKTKKHFKKNKKSELHLLEEENGELKAKLIYHQAEFQNYKRRSKEEFTRAMKYQAEEAIIKILPTLDNFERALQMDDKDKTDEISQFLTGFEMIYKNLNDILISLEVTEIASLNQKFDPNLHQAVLTATDENVEDGIILAVLQKGYLLKDKVLRPTMVKVNKKEKGEKENE